ncbi:hypothetical protein Tco_0108799 [Tanacetum coccineum]
MRLRRANSKSKGKTRIEEEQVPRPIVRRGRGGKNESKDSKVSKRKSRNDGKGKRGSGRKEAQKRRIEEEGTESKEEGEKIEKREWPGVSKVDIRRRKSVLGTTEAMKVRGRSRYEQKVATEANSESEDKNESEWETIKAKLEK